jgi:hypothetical protein
VHPPLPDHKCQRRFCTNTIDGDGVPRYPARGCPTGRTAPVGACAPPARLPRKNGVIDGKTSGLSINRALASWIALNRRLDRPLGRRAPHPGDRDADRRSSCRRSRIASGKPESVMRSRAVRRPQPVGTLDRGGNVAARQMGNSRKTTGTEINYRQVTVAYSASITAYLWLY